MLKKTITYTDFDGEQASGEFYFNLNKAEIAELELSYEGGFSSHLTALVDKSDGKGLVETFKLIIKMAYGVRSEDGKRFIKNDEVFAEFQQTEAYSELFMELIGSDTAAARFVEGIMPADLRDQALKTITTVDLPDEVEGDNTPAWIREDREPTQQELTSMSQAQLIEAMRRKTERLSQ